MKQFRDFNRAMEAGTISKNGAMFRKMTLIAIILVAICITAQAQYSTYYNVNVTDRKTITTIDYGALALANAQREANRLEDIKYADERESPIGKPVKFTPFILDAPSSTFNSQENIWNHIRPAQDYSCVISNAFK